MCLDPALFTEIEKSHKRFEIELEALLKDIDEGRIDIQFAYQQLAEIKKLMNKQKEKLKVLWQ
jgi:hypothetical protein